jgi:uncharacterized membrane protein
MSTRNTTIIVTILILASGLAGLLLWNRLPESMATHWGMDDVVNGFMPRLWGVLIMPIISAGMLIMFLIIPSIDPFKANIEQFRGNFNAFIVMLVIFLTYANSLSLAWNLGYHDFKMSHALLPATGLLFIFIGLLISKAKRNFFVGIRTPWTLSSDKVWDETHRLGGKLFSAAGAVAMLGFFFPDNADLFLMLPLIGAAGISVVYSFILYRREIKG